jgi:hypothetical protein
VADERKVQKSAKSVSELKTAADLTEKLEDLRRQRKKFEQDWKLNLAFYRGNQYAYFTPGGRLETLETEDGRKPRYRVRLTADMIKPGVQSLLSKLTKTKPVMSATPASGSEADVKAAQLAETLLEDWWITLDEDDKEKEALLWSIVAGQGWWKISWDEHAGVPMTFTMNPETGQAITNDKLIEQYKKFLVQNGLPEDFSDQTVYMGDIKIDVLSPFQVWLDPTARTWSEAKYAICEHSMDPDAIYGMFGKRFEADAVPTEPDKMLPFVAGSASSDSGDMRRSVKKVYFGYFVPQPALPKGRYVVWVEDAAKNEQERLEGDPKRNILADEPYPEVYGNELPLVKFSGIRIPGSVYDDADVTGARPLQKELNRTISQIVEYKNLTIKPRVWAPLGSLKTRITTEPGAVYEFQPVAGMRPEVEQLPTMPPYVFEHLKDITMRLREQFGLNDVTEGSVPPNVEAGVAIDLLQEMSTDRIAPRIMQLENALAKAGKLMLMLAQEYYVEERLLRIRGEGGSMQVKRFKGADIKGGVDVFAESGSGLPRTRAGRQARVMELLDRGVIAPHQAWKHIDLADMRSVGALLAADEDQAYREHDRILSNQPVNPVAFASAMQAVEQGMNPETGQPLASPEEGQQVLEIARLMPGPNDNDPAHLEIHHRLYTSVEYEGLPLNQQQAILTHIQLTEEQSRAKAPKPEGQAPRVNLALKGTLGPTVASEIMQQAGIDATPEEFTEVPLETWVTDSMDKPDADEAGNDPYTQSEQLLKMSQERDTHNVKTAQAMHSMQLAQSKAQMDAMKAEGAERRANEDAEHNRALKEFQARESAEAARKAANKPSGGKA